MAGVGEVSCSTSLGQTSMFGLMSTALASVCASNVDLCCATRTDLISNVTANSYTILPMLLSALISFLTGMSGITLATSNSLVRTVVTFYGSWEDGSDNYIKVETKDCTGYLVLQFSLVILTLASLPTLVGSCVAPPPPPPPPAIIPIIIPFPTTAPPLQVPLVDQLRALLFPASREAVIPISGGFGAREELFSKGLRERIFVSHSEISGGRRAERIVVLVSSEPSCVSCLINIYNTKRRTTD